MSASEGETEEVAPDRQEEEQAWIASIAEGGPHAGVAMKALHHRYQVRFRAYLRSRGFTGTDIDDVLQHLWMDVARKARAFAKGAVPSAWLWGFLNNEMREALRNNAQLAARFSPANDDAADAADGAFAATPTAETAHAARDLRECVDRAFRAFKRQHPREAWWVYLRHVHDWDMDQIAHHRGSSLHAAAQFLSQARALFRPFVAPCLNLRPE